MTPRSRDFQQDFQRALAHHQAGRLDQAEVLYRRILGVAPDHPDSLHLLGVIAHQVGRNDVAIDLIGKAIAVNGRVAAFHCNLGEAFRNSGRPGEAIDCYRRALDLEPDDPDVLNNLGLALQAQGRVDEAIARYTEALRLSPDNPLVHNNLGTALRGRDQPDRAMDHYRQALRLKPDYPEALYNLGLVLQDRGRLDEAIIHYTRALALRPVYPEVHNNLGNALQTLGRLEEAIGHYLQTLRITPDAPETLNNLGSALQEQGRPDQAILHYTRALQLRPDYPEALNNLGSAFQDQDRLDQAIAHYTQALRLNPGLAEAHNNLGLALHDQGRLEEALDHIEQALRLKPDLARALFARCLAQIPILYDTEAEIARRRTRYRDQLERLVARADRLETLSGLEAGVAVMQPFLLAYQGLNDRDLQSRYGALVCRIMNHGGTPAPLAGPPAPGEPVRVGVVSGFFSDHTIWKLFKGWVEHLDRGRFRLFGYHTGSRRDHETARAATCCHRFVQGPLSVAAWRETILSDRPHVLIYPEIGMNPMASRLAAQRLAPVQCSSWGHPDTSGYPTIDYFLSSDLMEPAEADEHYTERLVRLPNLSIWYQPPAVPATAASRSEFGLRPDATVYWCCQSLYKYLPQYDEVFARIARGAGDCQFVFITYPKGTAVTEMFRNRLHRAFSATGLDSADHCVFLPRLDQSRFLAASGLCDVFLDSIGWSGGNTTLESLIYALPIVTLPGRLMRSRHSLAILTRMGIADTIAGTVDEYVAIAIRLARDKVWRDRIRDEIPAGAARVYRDHACISALESFLDQAARSCPDRGLAPVPPQAVGP